MTKGSRQRPFDKDKFDKNFEKIFGNKKKKIKKKSSKFNTA
mgnify:CR=1 FL=1|tara:strand:+ start:2523 stop:2645 length:123 start_codon:yes stop_codon:yes gene_type:complete